MKKFKVIILLFLINITVLIIDTELNYMLIPFYVGLSIIFIQIQLVKNE